MGITSPVAADSIRDLVDWLELSAFLCSGRARLDALIGAIDIGADNDNSQIDSIGDHDTREQQAEDLANQIADEIETRREALDQAYPFQISSNGESFSLNEELNYGGYAYLVCLILHHYWSGSGKLEGDYRPTGTEIAAGRNILEIFAVYALHSVVDFGHVFYIGRNRRSQSNLLEMLNECCLRSETETQVKGQEDIPDFAPDQPNDDGVDIIGIHAEPDGPPPRHWVFVQVAAGENYPDKGLRGHLKPFCETWFSTPPVDRIPAMMVPWYETQERLELASRKLGTLYHRLRLPRRALEGYGNPTQETHVHFVDDPMVGCAWLHDYRSRVCAAA